MTIWPKAIYRFNTNSVRTPVEFLIELDHFLKICMETQKTQNSQNHLEKEKQSWRNNFKWSLIHKKYWITMLYIWN